MIHITMQAYPMFLKQPAGFYLGFGGEDVESDSGWGLQA